MATDTAQIVRQFADALRADRYKVQLQHPQTQEGFWVEYTPDQLARSVGYLRYQNRQGFNIYVRPVGWQYVLLDDLTRSALSDLARLLPCLLIETSPANYQAWLILPETPTDRDSALATCRTLAQQLGADLGSAEPDHVGRLPGFTNRKEKHRQPNGQYPFVRLCRSQHRVSTFYPCGGAVVKETVATEPRITPTRSVSKNSGSEHDFGLICGLIQLGRSDEQITAHLVAHSPNLAQRKGCHMQRYIERSIRKARKRLSA